MGMKILAILCTFFVVSLLTACDGSRSSPSAALTGEQSVRYRVTFSEQWLRSNFTTQFPDNAHFSGLVGATHNSQVVFWQPGQPASAGIKNMAETGGKSPFDAEIMAQIAAGKAQHFLSGPGITNRPGEAKLEFEVSRSFPQVTLVSMVAPSPDWFVGVHNLSLLGSDGEFVPTLTHPLAVYDAGTDSGATFTSVNSASPGDVIGRLTCQPNDCDFAEGVHRNPQTTVTHIGQFEFERL